MARARSKKVRISKRRLRKPTVEADDLDEHAVKAANMLYDPCNADLVPSVYPGDRGYVNRLTSFFTSATAATETNSIVIFKPGNNVAFNISPAATNTAVTPGFADTQAPGAAFLNSNASKTRCLGACLVVRPQVSPNNATGMIYFGVIPASAVPEGTAFNAGQLITQLNQSVSVAQALLNPLEIKWSPGTFDDRYSPVAGITSDDDTDRNVIVVVTTGMVAATGLSFRCTGIYEWSPQNNVGTTADATSQKPSRCDISCVLRNLKRKDSEWWFQLGQKTLKGAFSVAKGYTIAGVPGALASFRSMV